MKMLPLRKANGFKEVRGKSNEPQDTCHLCEVKAGGACNSGVLVPVGCSSYNRNTYWVVDKVNMLDIQEAKMTELQKELADARKAHKKFDADQLNKIWKLRGKIVILREDMK